MLYGERLKLAMEHRGAQLGREIERLELSKVAGCSPQNVGMILRNSQKRDQKFSTKSHAAVAAYLKVNPDWLLNETGEMALKPPSNAPAELTPGAIELALLYDMIRVEDRVTRIKAFNAATSAIVALLPPDLATDLPLPGSEK